MRSVIGSAFNELRICLRLFCLQAHSLAIGETVPSFGRIDQRLLRREKSKMSELESFVFHSCNLGAMAR